MLGTQLAGLLPLRTVPTGLLPVPGRSRYYNWRGFIPFKELPHRADAGLPWLAASTHPEGLKLPNSVAWLWRGGGARDRLRQLLNQGEQIGMDEVIRLQRESHSARGVQFLRRALSGLELHQANAQRVRDILLEWDGSTERDALGVSVYHVFRQQLGRLMLEARVGAEWAEHVRKMAEPLPGVLLARYVDRAGPHLDDSVLADALERTWNTLGIDVSPNPRKWTWGRVHQLRLHHDLARLGSGAVAWFGRRLSRGPFPVPGDADSVWTMRHQSVPTTEIGVGPAFRYTIDLGDIDHARFGLAGGQSGHPDSPYYDDGLKQWLRGRPRPLWMHRSDIEYHEAGSWELAPSSSP